MTLFASFESLTGTPDYIGYALAFIFGSVIGSFLNVVIYRVPLEKSIVYPGSACPECGTAIKPYDNIPMVSWLVLGGKCRVCKTPISMRYPLIELLTGLIFLLSAWRLGFTPFLPVGLIFAATMIALVFIDADHMILPNAITYPFLLLALIVRILFPVVFGPQYFGDMSVAPATWLTGWPVWLVSVISGVLGAIAGGGFLWLIGEIWKRARGVEAMGLGDVKMMLGVGMLLGWRLSLLTIFAAAFFGSIVGVFVLARQKNKDLQTQIPFGIFLGPASIAALLFGEDLIGWYLQTFVP